MIRVDKADDMAGFEVFILPSAFYLQSPSTPILKDAITNG